MKEFTSEQAKIQTAARESATCERVADYYSLYVGLDVHKNSIAIGVAWPGRGEAEHRGEIANKPKTVAKLVQRLSEEGGGGIVLFCYEAGPCGYGSPDR